MHVSRAERLVMTARRAGLLVAPMLALAPVAAVAQDGVNDFDLRPRATPTPAPPPIVGPVDPENPTLRTRPRADPRPEPSTETQVPPPAVVLPEARSAPSPTVARRPAATAQPRTGPGSTSPAPSTDAAPGATAVQPDPRNAAAPLPSPAAPAAPAPYQPRQLDVVSKDGPSLLWALLGGLAILLAMGGWLLWSRHLRHRARALPEPEILRPHVPAPSRADRATPPVADPVNDVAPVPALGLVLQATRMSATLINTTLSYRLSITNNGPEPLQDVVVAGDMIAAHASRPAEELLGARGAALPELHRIAALAPGESVTLGGDIRLPLVSITPIRSGNAALFVPLARLRARGSGPGGATIENGGTFLVGQPAAATKGVKTGRLQPFRLDLGPRNYSKLGQQLLPAA